MFRRLSFFAGLTVGYLVGTQASARQRDRISTVVDRVINDPRLRRSPAPFDADPLRRTA